MKNMGAKLSSLSKLLLTAFMHPSGRVDNLSHNCFPNIVIDVDVDGIAENFCDDYR